MRKAKLLLLKSWSWDEYKDEDEDKMRTMRCRKGKIMYDMSPLTQELLSIQIYMVYEEEEDEPGEDKYKI